MLLKTENKGDDIISYFDSSNLPCSIFSRKNKAAIVFFIRERGGTTRGNQYLIAGITESEYRQFENADSQGRYYRDRIQNNRTYTIMKNASIDSFRIDEIMNEIRSLKKNNRIDE